MLLRRISNDESLAQVASAGGTVTSRVSVVSPRRVDASGSTPEKSARMFTRVCARDPHLQAEGRIIDVLTSSRQTTIALTQGDGAHTSLLAPLTLPHGCKRTHNLYVCTAHVLGIQEYIEKLKGYKFWYRGMRDFRARLALMAVARTIVGKIFMSTMAPSKSGPKNGT